MVISGVAALVAFATTAAAGLSPSTVVVGGGSSTQRDIVSLLTGSRDALVYELQHRLASDIGGPPGLAGLAPYAVVARTVDGSTSTLSGDDAAADLQGWSAAGALVSARNATDPLLVEWWNLANGHNGTLTLPVGARYLSAAPGGVLSMTADGTVTFEDLAGVPSPWANPFGERPAQVFTGIGPHGAVLGTATGRVAYLRFADPHTARKLHPGRGSDDVICWAVGARYAACTTHQHDRPLRPALLPLDGRPAIRPTHTHARFGPVALVHGDHLMWERFASAGARGVLAAITPGDRTPVVGRRSVAFGALRSAYGAAITTAPAATTLLKATGPRGVVRLEPAPRSPATAAAFALKGNRLFDIDDVRNGTSDGAVAVRLRASSGPDAARPTSLAHPAAPIVRNVEASRNRYAYTTSRTGYLGTLHVVGPTHTRIIKHVVTTAGISLSDPWVAYRSQAPGRSARRLHVRNLVTSTDTVYAKQGEGLWDAAVIVGDTLYFAKPSGRILAADLTTGKETELSPAIPQFAAIRVYAAAGRVGWDVWQGGDANAVYTDVIRDADGTTTQLDERLVGLSEDGALLSTTPTRQFGFATQAEPTDISLRAWDGTVTPLLTGVRLAAPPQLANGVLAWLTSDGVLQAARLS